MTDKIVLLKLNCGSHCDYDFNCCVAIRFSHESIALALCDLKFPAFFSYLIGREIF